MKRSTIARIARRSIYTTPALALIAFAIFWCARHSLFADEFVPDPTSARECGEISITYPYDTNNDGVVNDADNQFSFNSASPAVLTIQCHGQVTTADSSTLRWTIQNAGEIAATWSPHVDGNEGIGTGPDPVLTYTGMPLHNSGFGLKVIILRSSVIADCMATVPVQLFYEPMALNNPGDAPQNPPSGISESDLIE